MTTLKRSLNASKRTELKMTKLKKRLVLFWHLLNNKFNPFRNYHVAVDFGHEKGDKSCAVYAYRDANNVLHIYHEEIF